jgi:F0F1-type ATP synthase assembly protein I
LTTNNNDERYKRARQAGLLGTLPFMLAIPPVAGVLIGRWLDERFGTTPLFTVVLVIMGFVAGIREILNVLKKADLDSDNRKNKDEKPDQ